MIGSWQAGNLSKDIVCGVNVLEEWVRKLVSKFDRYCPIGAFWTRLCLVAVAGRRQLAQPGQAGLAGVAAVTRDSGIAGAVGGSVITALGGI